MGSCVVMFVGGRRGRDGAGEEKEVKVDVEESSEVGTGSDGEK